MAPAPTLMTVDDYFTKTPETVKPMELVYGLLRARTRRRPAISRPCCSWRLP